MKTFFTCVFLVIGTLAMAQLGPVNWSFDVSQVNDQEYDIIFDADIAHGWSLYSQHLEAGKGPIPTSFAFDQMPQIQLIGETKELGRKKEVFDETFGMMLVKYTHRARFVQRVKVENGDQVIKGFLTYMTCDDKSCLPPEDVNFEINLN